MKKQSAYTGYISKSNTRKVNLHENDFFYHLGVGTYHTVISAFLYFWNIMTVNKCFGKLKGNTWQNDVFKNIVSVLFTFYFIAE